MKILIMLTLLPLCTQSLRESASPALHRSKSEGEWTRAHTKKRWGDIVVVVSLSPHLTAIRDDIVAHPLKGLQTSNLHLSDKFFTRLSVEQLFVDTRQSDFGLPAAHAWIRITWSQWKCDSRGSANVCVCASHSWLGRLYSHRPTGVTPSLPFLPSVGGEPVNRPVIAVNMEMQYSHQGRSAGLMDNFCHLSRTPLLFTLYFWPTCQHFHHLGGTKVTTGAKFRKECPFMFWLLLDSLQKTCMGLNVSWNSCRIYRSRQVRLQSPCRLNRPKNTLPWHFHFQQDCSPF